MKLYHYTSIDTLALILKNQTIRFSRLDTVDDPEEFQFERDGLNPAQYVFVSCWTKLERENIPQWKMYTQNHGVRIGLDSDMFDLVEKDHHKYLLPNEDSNDYMVMPLLYDEDLFNEMVYVEDPKSYIDNIFTVFNRNDAVDFKEMGLYKNQDWSFQHEYRYHMFVFPKTLNGQRIGHLNWALENKVSLEIRTLDVPIKEQTFENMEIMLAPCVTEAEKSIVTSLMQMYLGRNDYKVSSFTGKIVY